MVAVYSENNRKYTDTFCGQNHSVVSHAKIVAVLEVIKQGKLTLRNLCQRETAG
jgi:hypothetical protein